MNRNDDVDVSWVATPRILASDKREGKLTGSEFDVLIWIFLNTDPFARCKMSLEDLQNDVFAGRITKNAVNVILLSLKRKKYLYYKKRTGRRGSFDVRPNNFLMKGGGTFKVGGCFDNLAIRGESRTEILSQSEAIPEVPKVDQKLSVDSNSNSGVLVEAQGTPIRGDNKEIENENKKNIEGGQKSSKVREIALAAMPEKIRKRFNSTV